jgi:hypothetical protein
MDRLAEMFVRQAALQRQSYNIDFTTLGEEVEDRAEYIRMSVLAGIVELTEALNETGWKTWATNRDYDAAKVVAELVDAWHFMMNVMLASGIAPETLASAFFDAYVAKSQRNAERQVVGYDGREEKCPHCFRALDDVGVGQDKVMGETVFVCGHCNLGIPLEQVLGSELLNRQVRAAKIMNQS